MASLFLVGFYYSSFFFSSTMTTLSGSHFLLKKTAAPATPITRSKNHPIPKNPGPKQDPHIFYPFFKGFVLDDSPPKRVTIKKTGREEWEALAVF